MTTLKVEDKLLANLAAVPLELQHLKSSLLVGLADSANAVRSASGAARYVPLTDGAGGGVRVTTSPGRLMGYAVRETSGTGAALVKFHDGSDVGGDVAISLTLAAGESARDWFGPGGISIAYGLTVEIVSGQVTGTAFVGDL
jgi:hypothetical protein